MVDLPIVEDEDVVPGGTLLLIETKDDTGILGGGMPLSHSADGTELNDKGQTAGTRFSGIEVRERRVFLLWQQVNPLYDPGRRKSSSATRGNSPVTHRLG